MNRQSCVFFLFRLITAAFILILLLPSPGPAQYFGRNKVQYSSFDFHIMKTDHFDVYYYPVEEQAARDAARLAERWYARYSKFFHHTFKSRKPLIFYANHADFEQTNAISGFLDESTGGVTEGIKDRVVIPLTGNYAENDHVIGHELVHAFQYDIAQNAFLPGATGASQSGMANLEQLPLWFIEGMAEYLSLGKDDPLTTMWLRDAVLNDDIPSLSTLAHDMKYFPYRFGEAVWSFVGGTWGDETVARLLYMCDTTSLDNAIKIATGVKMDSLSKRWEQLLRDTYRPQLKNLAKASDIGSSIISEDKNGGQMNLSPVISPDGSKIAFLSERDLFSIDLFIADARTGKMITKLVSSGTDFHSDAISFINSSGTWSPDGQQFAYIDYAEGQNQLVISDVENGSLVHQYGLDSVHSLRTPAWSPDGKTIAFSGSVGGIEDLYLLDVQSGSVHALTHDRFTESQPVWSPDGKFIAFATDRGVGTDFDQMVFSPLRIGIMNVETGDIDIRVPFIGAKHISPAFSPDGKSLYFISDRNGFNDIYRIELATGSLFQITHAATGTLGLTASSPSLSIAEQTGMLAFSTFNKRSNSINTLDSAHAQGVPVIAGPVTHVPGGIMPPLEPAKSSSVMAFHGDQAEGLPSAGAQFAIEDYSPSFKLDYVGQAAVGIATDRFGSYVGGGVSMFFSDMLGNRNLGLVLQSSSTGSLQDIGGEVAYQNVGHRWNWGAGLSHIPYIAGYTSLTSTSEGLEYDQYLQRVYDDEANFIVYYPFSQTRRVEMTVGFTRISYNLQLYRSLLSNAGVTDLGTQDLGSPPSLNLFQGAIALVGDNSFFGFTSPVAGTRYRLELEPTVGSLTYIGLLADYRQYFLAKPFIFAFRALHYGRYGKNAENTQITPLSIGYSTLVRGYDLDSWDVSEFSGDSTGATPQYDRLNGSRLGVVNAEIRFPLTGTERWGLINFPFLATELVAFADGGAAWTSTDPLIFKFATRTSDRVPVFSAGGSIRVNLLGYAVLEFYEAHPFQRPTKNWEFGWQVAAGW